MNCTPLACQQMTGKYCGSVGDGCGRAMDCGGCAAGQTCSASGLCVVSNCVPLTCNAGTSRFCGTIGDGCGGMLDCGGCQAPATCAGRGIPDVCGDPNCKPITCMPAGGGQYCGHRRRLRGHAQLQHPLSERHGLRRGAPGRRHGDPERLPWHGAGGVQRHRLQGAHLHGHRDDAVSGTVRDPAGKVPLYNVIVYVPNAPLDPIPEGASCDRCSAQLSGKPIATALTDANGRSCCRTCRRARTSRSSSRSASGAAQITSPPSTACVDNPITTPT